MDKTTMHIRSVDTDTRTIEGIAAPYGQTIDAGDYFERFEKGAFGDIQDVRLFSEHDHLDKRAPIGVVLEGKDTDEGFVIKARISNTEKGNEVYELVKDGVLKNFSVGFMPVEDRVEDDNTVVRTKVDLKEVSVVTFPAYSSAQILAVRSQQDSEAPLTENTNNEKGDIMSDINYASTEDVADLRNAVDEMERRMAVMATDNGDTNAGPLFRSGGDFLKALATGDDKAQNEVRAYTGATTADSHVGNDWKATLLNIVDKGRPVVNLFSRGPLGPSGNTVEYPFVNTTTGDVGEQVAEGDDLNYLEVTIDTATAAVKTFGGYSALSRQVIERSDVSYLDTVLKYQAASYAKTTNDYVRSALTGATPQAGTSFTLATATAKDFLGAVVDGVAKIDANGDGAQADFILVSPDVYAAMIQVDANATAFDLNGSAGQTLGSANVRGISGSLVGLPIVVDAGLAAKTFFVASSVAVTSWENAGAPLRLQDENIINLTKTFSLYGYMAAGVTNANGLVKATVA